MITKWRRGRPPLLRWERGLPRLVLSKRWEATIRWTTRLTTLLGVVAALLALAPLQGVLLAAGLVTLEWFLERSIFLFVYIHLTPFPKFEYDPNQWESMAYLFEGAPGGDEGARPIGVGLVFHSVRYAKEFFGLLRAWNFDQGNDGGNNIRLSFIIDEDLYYVFLYPSFERDTIRESWQKLQREPEGFRPDREPFLIVMSLVICKNFSTMAGYHLGFFLDAYRQGEPYDLLALQHTEAGPVPIRSISPIRKYHLKGKPRADLEPDEFERIYMTRRGI